MDIINKIVGWIRPQRKIEEEYCPNDCIYYSAEYDVYSIEYYGGFAYPSYEIHSTFIKKDTIEDTQIDWEPLPSSTTLTFIEEL